MTQLLDQRTENTQTNSLSSRNRWLLCHYTNQTRHIQIARISNIPNWYFEKVIFPSDRLLFEALPVAVLEIYSSALSSETPLDQLFCRDLQVAG